MFPKKMLVAIATFGAFAGPAVGGQVRGRIVGAERLLNPVWNEAKETASHRYSFREPSPTVRAELRAPTAYAPKEVCVAALAASGQPASSAPAVVALAGGRMAPATVVVPPGTRVRFENRDPWPHRLLGVGQATFPAGETAVGGSREWTAPGAGRFEIRDELSPSVRGWVVVETNVAATAYPNRDGTFVIPPLPPGDYTVRAYFAGAPVGTARQATIKTEKADAELREPLPVAEQPPADKADKPDKGSKR